MTFFYVGDDMVMSPLTHKFFRNTAVVENETFIFALEPTLL